jgi:hypothetical protein
MNRISISVGIKYPSSWFSKRSIIYWCFNTPLDTRTLDLDKNEYMDIYNFGPYDMKYIEKGNAKVAHTIPLVDGAFSKRSRLWSNKGTIQPSVLQIIHNTELRNHALGGINMHLSS